MRRFLTKNEEISTDIEIGAKNLIDLDQRQSTLFKSRIALIKELAYSVCHGGDGSFDEIRHNYFNALGQSNAPFSEVEMYFDGISIYERIGLCREISKLSPKGLFIESVLGQSDPCDQSAKGKISYVKNNFTDSAYLTFSKVIKSSRCSYSDSFETVCELFITFENVR